MSAAPGLTDYDLRFTFQMTDRSKANFALAVLFAINTLNFFDRQVFGAIAEPVRKEWALSDSAIGLIGTAFTLVYAAVGLPLGRLADRASRKRVLAGGVFVWSLLTAASGLARNYWQLFVLRLGVGVGEATCAPAATALIGDLYPAEKRSRALSLFMLGLPVGIALSYAISGSVAQAYGWRAAFYVAGLPGLLCTLAILFICEPRRGAAEIHDVGARKRAGSPYRLVLSIPTMWWIIASGALQTFNMYAIGQFLTPFLMRYHHQEIRTAGFTTMAVFGLSGIPGLLLGGVIGDAVMKRWANGRLSLATLCLLASVPLIFLALMRPSGATMSFILLMGPGVAVMNVYYATVYPAIQDVIEPALRGTAMSIYFFAMYVLGAALGPLGTGLASDFFTTRAAAANGVIEITQKTLEPFRAQGLHSAMYIIPALGCLLTLVLFAGSRTVARDIERLHGWMRESELDSNSTTKASTGAGDRPVPSVRIETAT